MAETLTRQQVLAKAQDLGLVYDKRAKTTAVLKMISDLTGDTYEEEVKEKPKTNDKDNDEAEMTLAILDGSGNERVQIKIGEEINLENKFIGVLKDAVIETHVPVLDEDGEPTGKSKMRKTPRYILERL